MSMPLPPVSASAPGQPIPNHLAWAIVATVVATCLCCPLGLLGIVAIVYASQVNTKLGQSDFTGAQASSNSARTWCWVATGLAILGLLINIAVFATGGAARYMEILQQAQGG